MVMLHDDEVLIFAFGDYKEKRKSGAIFSDLAKGTVVTREVRLYDYVDRWVNNGQCVLDKGLNPGCSTVGEIWAIKKENLPILDWYFGIHINKTERVNIKLENFSGVQSYVYRILSK